MAELNLEEKHSNLDLKIKQISSTCDEERLAKSSFSFFFGMHQ